MVSVSEGEYDLFALSETWLMCDVLGSELKLDRSYSICFKSTRQFGTGRRHTYVVGQQPKWHPQMFADLKNFAGVSNLDGCKSLQLEIGQVVTWWNNM